MFDQSLGLHSLIHLNKIDSALFFKFFLLNTVYTDSAYSTGVFGTDVLAWMRTRRPPLVRAAQHRAALHVWKAA